MAVVFEKMKDSDQAIEYYDQAIEYYSKALQENNTHQIRSALRDIQRAKEKHKMGSFSS